MKLSNRLKGVASFAEENSFILDIGCDHALLSIYLEKNFKNIKIIASDINDMPLNKARENIIFYETKNITLKLANGMDAYEEGIDTIILSGLGTSTILDILLKDKTKLEKINKIIISSNNNYYELRKTLTENGFIITGETIILEKDKFYPIICFEKGIKKYSKKELAYGPILVKENSDTFKKFIKYKLNKLSKINKNLENTKDIKLTNKISKEIRELEKLL